MNLERFTQILRIIIEHPECWDQTQWHCGTSHCVAGWAEILSLAEKEVLAIPAAMREVNAKYADRDGFISAGRDMTTRMAAIDWLEIEDPDCAVYVKYLYLGEEVGFCEYAGGLFDSDLTLYELLDSHEAYALAEAYGVSVKEFAL